MQSFLGLPLRVNCCDSWYRGMLLVRMKGPSSLKLRTVVSKESLSSSSVAGAFKSVALDALDSASLVGATTIDGARSELDGVDDGPRTGLGAMV